MSIADQIRRYWDADAATYDQMPSHRPTSAGEIAAWSSALARLLPAPPSRVLDCGAGTGFLSLIAARLGHKVTALDLSPGMLAKLHDRATAEGVGVEIVEGPADQPPPGPFDAVMERHLLWTLPDPVAALRAWRAVAPGGRLVVIESVRGDADRAEALKAKARALLGRARGRHADHHAPYSDALLAALPMGRSTSPSQVVETVSAAGWPDPWLERLHDVEWATAVGLPMPDRLLGVAPRFTVTAG
ncbi:methyltransferase domain-containing protein [Acidiferrimicrobium sp. IK]|uniref:class I SAM-dependent methyltransferase n=1 Tax=Acidiferrimicrobium sp. IK TaxID=2871700 RepID=UPI0021CB4A65|nr:methyltransferase domain-containing protein [Acidiferrimicrobium sp. IK]MCU4186100.1 methyltransferase domain-containing protein [Acidiferrimicrobium sp. IK]